MEALLEALWRKRELTMNRQSKFETDIFEPLTIHVEPIVNLALMDVWTIQEIHQFPVVFPPMLFVDRSFFFLSNHSDMCRPSWTLAWHPLWD